MDSRAVFQSQITRILDALVRAAVLQISELLVKEDAAAALQVKEDAAAALQLREDAVVLQVELKRREEEIQNLLGRLQATEEELHSIRSTMKPSTSHTCSVAVQVKTSKDMLGYGGGLSPENQFCAERPMQLLPCREGHALDAYEDLEFEVKIEQVEEPKEERCSQTECDSRAADQNIVNCANWTDPISSELWISPGTQTQEENHQDCEESDYSSGFEQRRKYFLAQAEQYAAAHMLIQDNSCSLPSMNLCSTTPGNGSSHGEGVSETKRPDQTQQSRKGTTAPKPKSCKAPLINKAKGKHAQSQSEPSAVRENSAGLRLYRCGECGKRFTQRNRLVSHQWVHTGERPYRCKICGKMFSRQDNCQRHERLHS